MAASNFNASNQLITHIAKIYYRNFIRLRKPLPKGSLFSLCASAETTQAGIIYLLVIFDTKNATVRNAPAPGFLLEGERMQHSCPVRFGGNLMPNTLLSGSRSHWRPEQLHRDNPIFYRLSLCLASCDFLFSRQWLRHIAYWTSASQQKTNFLHSFGRRITHQGIMAILKGTIIRDGPPAA